MNNPIIKKLLVIALWLGVIVFASRFAPNLLDAIHHNPEGEMLTVFFSISFVCLLSFITFYLSIGTPFPPFVIAILFGIASQSALHPIVHSHSALAVIVSLGAALILFQGGLETPFSNFKKLFWKIFMLAFPGVIITGFLMSFAVSGAGSLAGFDLPIIVAILLGAVLASTDPAAIIPLLQNLKFNKREIKDIVVSESAMNDVVGALLTLTLVALISAGSIGSIGEAYLKLFGFDSAFIIGKQIIFGVLFGFLGYLLLDFLSRHKGNHESEYGADAAFFICVPIIAFTGAMLFGGSGYLATFVAGLIFNMAASLKRTEHFFNHMIDGFFKPVIFILLGALVNVGQMFNYAVVGIIAALVFMFVLRPLMVFIMLSPFRFFGKDRLTTKEILFISFVRETGAIPAVLLVTIVSMGLPGIEALVPIGMWVILLTLILEPPFTPWAAKKLEIAQ